MNLVLKIAFKNLSDAFKIVRQFLKSTEVKNSTTQIEKSIAYKRVSSRDLSRQLSTYLDAVESGQYFEITRYGRVVAKLIPSMKK